MDVKLNVKLYETNAIGRDLSTRRATALSATDQAKQPEVENTGSYDKLTLNKVEYPSDTKQFAQMLTREIKKEMQLPTSQARIEELRDQVAAGTYTPSADLIACRMLCY